MAERRKILLPIDNNEIGKGELSLSYVSSSMTINNGSGVSIKFASEDVLKRYTDSAVMPYFDSAEYNSAEKKIYFRHNGVVNSASTIDATDFIKDGMVDNVEIKDVVGSGTCLVITFNTGETGAGKEDINIPLASIFNPENYYDKDDIDAREQVTTAALTDLGSRLGAVESAYVNDAAMTSASTPSIKSGTLYIPEIAGPMGPQGAEGYQGPMGAQGPEGKQGPRGPQGFKGDRGEVGVKGDTGPKGEDGAQGFQGPQGKDGSVAEVPIATTEQLGVVKVGNGLSITSEGVLSANGLESVSWDDIKNKPDTLTGYGITDAVQKEEGKGLSSNDYTTEEKEKLASVVAGAEVNVQADWNVTDDTSDAYIKNKPNADLYIKVTDVTSGSTYPVWKYNIATGIQGPDGKSKDSVHLTETILFNALKRKFVSSAEMSSAATEATISEYGKLTIPTVKGPEGPQGADGAQGYQGPQGADGKGVNIKGSYTTYEELIAAHPEGEVGDAYMVGPDLYVWNDINREWKDVGNIQGPEGKQGPKGPQGAKGADGTSGTDGKQGPEGKQGPKGIDGTSGTDGKQGPQGAQGPKGADGTNGAAGTNGKQGPQGAQGPKATTDEVIAAGTGVWLPLSGGTLTGALTGTTAQFTQVNASNGFFETSDEDYKVFGEDIVMGSAILDTLPKKYFYWKDDDSKKQNIGTSAQAVRRFYPELVSEDKNGKLSVDYAKLSVVALAAIDMLRRKIERLTERIEKLENKK